jgi:hypothetical protein
MDLEGTELVTLSACETGLGGLQSGEGVYGLQRALAVAGARSTLLSLWKVDDGLTAAFMESYYKRLKVGEGRADALRNTQSEFRNHKNSTYNDIRVWGAFQLSGDWRPMQRWRSTQLTLVDAPHSLLFRLIFLSLLLITWLRRPHQAARTLKGVVLVLPLMLSACADTRLNDGAAVNDAKSLLLQAWAADPVTASLPFPKIRLLSQDTSVDQACAHEGPPRRPAPLASYCAPNNEVLVDQDLLVSATQEASPAKARTVAAYWIATALAERLLAAVGADPLPDPVPTLQANCLSGNLLGAKPTLFSPPETKGLFDTARAAYGDSARAVVGSPSQRGYALLSGLGATASSCSSADMVALVNGTVPDSGLLRKIEQLPPPARGYSSMIDAINSQCQPLPNRPCPRRLAATKTQP